MKEEIQNPFPDDNCFFCGSGNAAGLKLKFYRDKGLKEVWTEYVPAQHFVGQGDILHGAIQMGLLDEIMGWTSYVFTQEMAVTSGINITFLQPTYISGEKIRVTCQVTSREGAKVNMHAALSNSKGEICTTATGTFHILPPDRYEDIVLRKP